MYKFTILALTILTVAVSFVLIQVVFSLNLGIQPYFLYVSEALFGVFLSGVSCFGKNEFQPYHILQIVITFGYVVVQVFMLFIAPILLNSDIILAINIITTFIFIVLLVLSILANNYSSTNNENIK